VVSDLLSILGGFPDTNL